MVAIPTIAVVDANAPGGYVLINESDFNPDEHKRYKGDVPAPPAADADSEPTAPIPAVQPTDSLSDMTLTQLRSLAQAEDISGRSSMDKDELINALSEKGYRR